LQPPIGSWQYPNMRAKTAQSIPAQSENPGVTNADRALASAKRPSWKRLAVAFALAVVSDLISFWTELVPPVQWVVDLGTAFLLFLILGGRWAILPGLIAEAIPGMGAFPVWVLVVISIVVYDDIKWRRK
jgi:hypothetical protein